MGEVRAVRMTETSAERVARLRQLAVETSQMELASLMNDIDEWVDRLESVADLEIPNGVAQELRLSARDLRRHLETIEAIRARGRS